MATAQQQGLTEWRAFRLFTDRNEHIRLFLSYLYGPTPKNTILFFHGEGGNGKSWLMRFLSEYACKQLPQNVQSDPSTLSYDYLVRFFTEDDTAPIFPHAHLDFGMENPSEDRRPKNPARALLMLRRDLARYSLRFPLYDYATLLYLHKTVGLTKERIRNLFPSEETSALSALFDLLTESSAGKITKVSVDLLRKHLFKNKQKQFTLWWQKLSLDETEVEALQRMDPDKELIQELPILFAKDLNAAMQLEDAPARVVLFFDTYEAFWGHERDLSTDEHFARDTWFRTLLSNLNLDRGIVAVVLGRDDPEVANIKVPNKQIDPHKVSYFSDNDANLLLERAGVTDPDLRQALVTYTSFKPNEVHPYYLGLCADVALAAANTRQILNPQDFISSKSEELAGKGEVLINRLLRYTGPHIERAVRALSACRAFNYEIYEMLGKPHAIHFNSTPTDFDLLTSFSFVWRTRQRGDGWFRIHDLLRKLYRENHDELTLKAHAALENYHHDRASNGEPTAIAEAIYHTNRLDWSRSITAWNEVFESVLRLSRHTICDALLEVRPELSIETDFMLGLTSANEGDYYARLARHKEARQEYLEAIVAYNKELVRAPDDVDAHNNKGIALQSLGDLQASLSQHTEALTSYQQAIASYQEALVRAPDYVLAHNNKGNALATLGNLQASLSQHTEALTSYQQAIASYQEALMRAPDYVNAHNNKGNVLRRLGDLQASLSQHTEALTSYQQAIASFQEALVRAPDYLYAHNNKGIALATLGNLQARLSQHTEALTSYQLAVASFQEALVRAPDYVDAHNNKGAALQSLGDLQASLSQHTEALTSYQQSIASFQEALVRAPDDVAAHNNKGIALKKMADLRSSIGQFNEAFESYEHALVSYDKALELAPNFIAAHNNKSLGLINKGILHSQLGATPEACISFHLALSHFTRALEISPNDPSANWIKSRIEELTAQLCTP